MMFRQAQHGGGSPSPQPSPIKGEGVLDGLRMRGGSPSPQPSPIKGEGVLDGLRMRGGSPSPQPSPIKGEGVLDRLNMGEGHPHPSPLPSRERVSWTGSTWGRVTLTPALSHQGRGCLGQAQHWGGSPSPQPSPIKGEGAESNMDARILKWRQLREKPTPPLRPPVCSFTRKVAVSRPNFVSRSTSNC